MHVGSHRELGKLLGGKALVWHVEGPEFHPQYCKKKKQAKNNKHRNSQIVVKV